MLNPTGAIIKRMKGFLCGLGNHWRGRRWPGEPPTAARQQHHHHIAGSMKAGASVIFTRRHNGNL